MELQKIFMSHGSLSKQNLKVETQWVFLSQSTSGGIMAIELLASNSGN